MNVHKFTLSTGKVVVIQDMKMKHQEMAIRAAGNRAGGNKNLHDLIVTQELVKILVVEVDGKALTPVQKEDLDELFTLAEYAQVQMGVNKISGGNEIMDPTYEMITR